MLSLSVEVSKTYIVDYTSLFTHNHHINISRMWDGKKIYFCHHVSKLSF